jgi:hypothetical protein
MNVIPRAQERGAFADALPRLERRGILGGSAARLIPRLAGASDSLSALERA